MKKLRVCFRVGILLSLLAAALTSAGQPVYTNLHAFVSGSTADGANPSGLVLAGSSLWGATTLGGSNGAGTIFSLATNGANYTAGYNFSGGDDGLQPNELLSAGGTFFGTAAYSDDYNGAGVVFRFDTNTAALTVLHTFTNSPDGANSGAGLVLAGATLYGTSLGGGTNNSGTVFKLATNGANYTVLHSFSNGTDGGMPRGRLLLLGSSLYGTASTGGANGGGTLFRVDTNGNNFSVLCTFSNSPAGDAPYAGLASDGAAMLYGTTASGGTNGLGTVFAVTTNGGTPAILHSFSNSEGFSPQGRLTLNNGTLFGTALAGGAGGAGTVFQLATNGANFFVLYNFTSTPAGSNPRGDLVMQNNTLFGTTVSAGPAGGGTVFALQTTPFITVQPQPLTVTNGNPASFSGAAGGVGALNYQWYLNGAPVAGANTNTLAYANVTTNQAGIYTLVASNFNGSVTSSPAMLTVLDVPWITGPPQSQLVTNGNPANFSVTAVNGTLTYQWYLNTNTLLLNQTNSTFNIAAVTTNDAGAYTVAVANNIGTSTSTPAILTVSLNTRPTITSPPQNLTVTNGDTATFNVGVFGLAPLQFQWYSNSVNTAIGTLLAGKTNSSLSYTNVGTNFNARYYSVVITNTLGKATSSPALLTVIGRPVIVTNPQPASAALSNSAAFAVSALGANLRFQWYSNSVNTAIGTLIGGQTNSNFSVTAITNLNGRYYSVVVSNSFGRATSSPPAQLTVIFSPVILTNPQPATVNYGGATNFTVSAAGVNPLRYQWYFNTNTLLLNQTNGTLPVPDATNSLAGFYSVIITNLYGSATSSPALLAITGGLPVITLQPLGATISIGSSITFTSSATGPGTLGYQWLFNTNSLVAGANATSLAIPGANQPGYYAMVATNNYGAATSSPALLNLTGQAVLLTSAFDRASGSYAFSYVNLAGSTNRLWATTNLANSAAWQVIATNIMATNGTWNFTDTNTAKTNAIRLYRFSSP